MRCVVSNYFPSMAAPHRLLCFLGICTSNKEPTDFSNPPLPQKFSGLCTVLSLRQLYKAATDWHIQQVLPPPLSSHFKTKRKVDGQGQMSHHSRSIRKQMSHNEQEFSERGTLSFPKRPQDDPAKAVPVSCHWMFFGEYDDSWSRQNTAGAAHRQAALPGKVTATALWSEAEWYEILTVISFRKNASQLLIFLPSP